MDINIRFGRKVQVVKYEDSVDYGVSVTDTKREGESDTQAVRRVAHFTAALFNDIEDAVLGEHGISEKAEPLTIGEGDVDDDTAESAAVEVATPPRRRKK